VGIALGDHRRPATRPDGVPASGGRGIGVVRHAGSPAPPEPSVLVVPTLDPRLAFELPGLGGLVSETGRPRTPLCIRARAIGGATGIVRHASTPPTPGRRDVLVVDALVPELAAELDHVAAIVSETGSPLSHLAILARELSIPVAVGVEDARTRFPEGCRVLVDGGSGSVTTEPEAIAS
jgi:pyruvate,water dikinase